MSFIRKFVSKLQLRKRSNASVSESENVALTQDDDSFPEVSPRASWPPQSRQTAAQSAATWPESVDSRIKENRPSFISVRGETEDSGEEAGCERSSSMSSIDRRIRKDRRKINKKLDKYRRERWRVQRKAMEVQHLQDEISSLMKMLTQLKQQKDLLEAEKNNKLREMVLTCKLVPEDISPEMRKKEPLQFKKYHSAKTVADTQNLLQSIHLKQQALQLLEVLTFKKMLNFEHRGFTSQPKNNNSMTMEDSVIEHYMQDARTHIEHLERHRDRLNLLSSNFFVQSSPDPVPLPMGPIPLAFDNPLYQSG